MPRCFGGNIARTSRITSGDSDFFRTRGFASHFWERSCPHVEPLLQQFDAKNSDAKLQLSFESDQTAYRCNWHATSHCARSVSRAAGSETAAIHALTMADQRRPSRSNRTHRVSAEPPAADRRCEIILRLRFAGHDPSQAERQSPHFRRNLLLIDPSRLFVVPRAGLLTRGG